MKSDSRSIAKYSGLLLVMLCLSACHSIIASQITKPLTPVFSQLSEEETRFFGEFFRYCDSNKKCLDLFLRQAQEVDSERTIKLSLIQGTEKKVFNVDLNETNRYSSEPGKLIVIFPGFGIDSRVYSGTLAPWLSHLSGSDVLVAPAANQNANFNFGLDSASLIAEYIKKSAYKNVSVLSFSMGAVAAIHLASLTSPQYSIVLNSTRYQIKSELDAYLCGKRIRIVRFYHLRLFRFRHSSFFDEMLPCCSSSVAPQHRNNQRRSSKPEIRKPSTCK